MKYQAMKKNIAVIGGGNSSEYEVSLQSAAHVFAEIDGERYNKYLLILKGRDWHIEENGTQYPVDKNDFSFTRNGEKVCFDYAYIIIHGNPGENGMLQGYLDMMGIPYSTCSTLCEAMTFDKYTCSNYVKAFGIQTSDPILIKRGMPYDQEAILTATGLPCFIKPNAEGSSFGVSKVKSRGEFDAAMQRAFEKCPEVLVESFLDGTEFTCGLYRAGGRKVILPVAEVIPKKEFFDYEAKYKGASEEIVPAPVSEKLSQEIKDISTRIYQILNCKGVVRCDFIVEDGTEDVYFLEVNTTPGQSAESIVPKQVRHMGWTLEEFYQNVITEALDR